MGLLGLLGHHCGLLWVLLLLLLLSVEVEKVPQDLLILLLLLMGRHGLELVLYRQLAEFKPTIVLRWQHPTSTSTLCLLLLLGVAPIETRVERILSNFRLGRSSAAPSRPEIKVCGPS